MNPIRPTRREFLRTSSRFAAVSALAGIAQARAALAAALASHSPEPATLELHDHAEAA
jgi:hypothetical protein